MDKFIFRLVSMGFLLLGVFIFIFFAIRIFENNFEYDLIKAILFIVLIIVGFYLGILLFKDHSKLKNLLVLFSTIIAILMVFEIILSTGYYDNLESNSPIWIPYRYRLINESINNKHRIESANNIFGFNDIFRKTKRDSTNLVRIAIMGDSFIWGAGVEDSIIWSRKLQKNFDQNKRKVEILHWGVDGWSSKNERDFLYQFGYKFDLDMIIIGVVVNDVDRGRFPLREFINRGGIFYKIFQRTILKVFPNSVSFLIDYLNAFANQYLGYGYINWLKLNYKKEYLLLWKSVIKDIILFGKKYNTKILFVLTPENHTSLLGKYFEKLEGKLKESNADYINLYPPISKTLKKFSNRELWANPADGHPGEKVTEIYAQYTFDYLLNNTKLFSSPYN